MAKRVLVIDDEHDIRQLVALILESDGCSVIQADNGPSGLQALEGSAFDLVVLDIMMPDMDGWQVCRSIRSQERTRKLPVLILTVRNQPLDREIGLEVVQANAYLTKPFERNELLSTVRELLGSTTARSS